MMTLDAHSKEEQAALRRNSKPHLDSYQVGRPSAITPPRRATCWAFLDDDARRPQQRGAGSAASKLKAA
ncbi:hypothetical protein QBS63_21190, partial [Cronobacter sakazakii]|nr:hypothetical protein [Cronobacter sakazakii]